jgi:transcriptional regulator with XRE-family HTH domain
VLFLRCILDFPGALTDVAVLEEFGSRLAAARLKRNLTQVTLAREAGVSRNTVERLERGVSVDLKLLVRVLRALSLLDSFLSGIPPDEPSPMALLKAQGRKRQRARGAPAGVPARKVTP